MYTITIAILLIFSIFLILKFFKEINNCHFLIVTSFFSLFAWIEFQFCNTYDILPCWQFYKSAILGIYILSIPIEDIFFAPICAVIFYIFWLKFNVIFKFKTENIEKFLTQKRVFVSFVMFLIMVALYFYCFGGQFGKYQNYRFIIGSIGIFLSYKNIQKFKLFSVLIFIFLFAWIWDIWAINTLQWCYKNQETLQYSKIWNSLQWFKIYHAWFSTCTLYYYLSGAIFFLGITESSFEYLNNYKFRKLQRLKV